MATLLYLGSRVSQIIKNKQRQTAEGLSILMFMLTITANLCTGMSILLRLQDSEQLKAQAPWLCGTFGTIALDATLFYQAFTYSRADAAAAAAGTDGKGGAHHGHHHHHHHQHQHGGGLHPNGSSSLPSPSAPGHPNECAPSGAGAGLQQASGGSLAASVRPQQARGGQGLEGGGGSSETGAAGDLDLEAPLLNGEASDEE